MCAVATAWPAARAAAVADLFVVFRAAACAATAAFWGGAYWNFFPRPCSRGLDRPARPIAGPAKNGNTRSAQSAHSASSR